MLFNFSVCKLCQQHEHRPLLEKQRIAKANVDSQSIEEKTSGSWKWKVFSLIAILSMIGVFFFYNNKTGRKLLGNKYKNTNINKVSGGNSALKELASIDWTDIKLSPDLSPYNGLSVDLVGDDSILNINTFNSMQLGGELIKESQNVVLNFFIDGSQKYVYVFIFYFLFFFSLC